LRYILLADDLSNESLFGFKRSLKLKQIALEFCAQIGAHLRIVHIDDPAFFKYQESLYKKYLDHAKLNQKVRIEKLSNGEEVRVEYWLEDGDAIESLTKILESVPQPLATVAGTSNRYGLGRLRTGSRIKRLVKCTTLPVFIFGLKAIRHFEYKKGEAFKICALFDMNRSVGEGPTKTLQQLTQIFQSDLKIIVFKRKQNIFTEIWNKIISLIKKPQPALQLESLRAKFPFAEIEIRSHAITKKNIMEQVRESCAHLVTVPENFPVSPFYIARRSSNPVMPLRDL